mmetsp:Transcript_82656/g.267578  ORF Transcript_82656/g.267578 Transcript_82656/m.267578 type:complete len:221 (-) Transcript_82656:1906-2568(-)
MLGTPPPPPPPNRRALALNFFCSLCKFSCAPFNLSISCLMWSNVSDRKHPTPAFLRPCDVGGSGGRSPISSDSVGVAMSRLSGRGPSARLSEGRAPCAGELGGDWANVGNFAWLRPMPPPPTAAALLGCGPGPAGGNFGRCFPAATARTAEACAAPGARALLPRLGTDLEFRTEGFRFGASTATTAAAGASTGCCPGFPTSSKMSSLSSGSHESKKETSL